MKSHKLFFAVVAVLLLMPALLAQQTVDNSTLYHASGLMAQAQALLLQVRTSFWPTGFEPIPQSYFKSSESINAEAVPVVPDILAVGDHNNGVDLFSDTRGRGQATSMSFFLRRPGLPVAQIIKAKAGLDVLALNGRLLLLTNVDNPSFADDEYTEFSIASGNTLLAVPSESEVWVAGWEGAINRYKFGNLVFNGQTFPGQQASFPSTRFLYGGGGNIVSMKRNPKGGDLYILDGTYGTIFKVPNNPTIGGLAWGRMEPIGSIPNAIQMAFDEQTADLYVVTAQIITPQPTPTTEDGGGGGGSQTIPSRLLKVTDRPNQPLETKVIWEGGPLNIWMGPVNGLAARGGRIYVITNSYPDYSGYTWNEIWLFTVTNGQPNISLYLPAHVLRTTLSGLAFLN